MPLRADSTGIQQTGDVTDITLVLAHAIKTANLLQNPDGAHGIVPWQGRGEAVPELNQGIPCFALRNGGSISQEIVLPRDSGGRFALVCAWLSSERINPDGAITGLPNMEVTMWPYRRRPDDKYLEGRIRPLPQEALETPGEWVWASGIAEIPPNAGRAYLFLRQAERLGVPHNGSASRFAGLGVYLFDTEAEAGLYRDYLMATRP